MSTSQQTIPIILCFNDNYVVPAICAISSLVRSSSPKYNFSFHILHSDISEKHQNRLKKLQKSFPNICIDFIDMGTEYDFYFAGVENKSYWSKEIIFKCLTPSLFPQYDQVIVTDVDVIFCDDITPDWESFKNDQTNYIAGVKTFDKKNKNEDYANFIYRQWALNERQKVLTGAGYWIQNLKLMRQHDMEKKFLDFAKANLYRLTQLEQQVVNMVCYPDIKLLHPKAMVCSYDYNMYRTEKDYKEDKYYSAEIVSEALKKPIQLHYAGAYKPWNVIFVTKAGIWWNELLRQCDIGLIFATFRIVIKEKKYFNLWKDWIQKMIVKNSFFSFCYKCFKKIFH